MAILLKIVIVILFSIIFLFIKHVKKRRTHPPGPLGFPIFGMLPYIVVNFICSRFITKLSEREYFKQMYQKYGDIWSIEIGSQRIITLASFDIFQEAFIDNGILFSGCPQNALCKLLGENRGILFVDGELWKRNRQLALKSLRNLGKLHMEKVICEEADNLVKHLQSICSSPINTSDEFVKLTSNVISHLNFNEINDYDNPEFQKFIRDVKHTANSDIINTIDLCPIFFLSKFGKYIYIGIANFLKALHDNRNFIAMKCEKRLRYFNEVTSSKCVFDYFWKCEDSDNSRTDHNNDFKLLNVVQSLTDLQNAGTETTYNFLGFCCLMLGRYPNVQTDLRNELQNLVDDSIQLTINMRKECPKLLSFIDEVQRFCNLILKIFRRVLEKCIFRGYEICPNDVIFGDLSTVSRDNNLFKDPELFDPYRFLNDSRTKYIPNKYVIPFGIGRRVCPGESLANMEIFLFLSRIIYKFHISLPSATANNFEKILEGEVGIVHSPLKHEIYFHPVN